MTRRTYLSLAVICAAGLLAAGCGRDAPATLPEPGPPVGAAVLPDLAPSPQLNVATQRLGQKWRMRFNTVIVNVGKGDFVLRGTRELGGPWTVEQDVPYSTSGARRVPTRAAVVWGGDGHEHWHIVRVASVWLVPLDARGKPASDSKKLIDTKVGFCFYDHTHELARGPAKAVYSADTCADRGEEKSTEFGMGLSPGWNDTYLESLPGQSIDITAVPDGKYRLFTQIDELKLFREATRANNLTWIDLDVQTTSQGRIAIRTATGPRPS
jgi:lysyl oxidase